MAATGISVKIVGGSKIAKQIDGLIDRLSNKKPAMEKAAAYMVRSTKLRITRDKRAPDGTPWAPLSPVTEELRARLFGNTSDSALIVFGDLLNSIQARAVTNRGFEVRAESDHAGYMQKGIKETRGMIKGKVVPKRPFLGISETNIRNIKKIIRQYIEGETETE